MQATLLYLLFLTTCGFVQEMTLLDVKKFPSAEENPSPNPDDGDISNNVEDLQRELIAERIKNRDLNQTISDILERMGEMERNIVAVQDDVIVVAADVEKHSADITTLATFGTWCGVKNIIWDAVGTITYDRITFSDSKNMNIAVPPLDINTGKCEVLSLSGYGYL